jgi:type I thyroxine 5'-deiodinase
VKENERDAVLLHQHRTMEERVRAGESCMAKLALDMPAVVDEMDDAVARAWAAMPERLYLLDRAGRVAYKGGMGPMFFRPKEWEAAIERLLGDA